MSSPQADKAVHIDSLDPDAEHLWKTISDIATALQGELSWCLVGGLMVQLFAHEAQRGVRPTTDIDILADARSRPSFTEVLAGRLQSIGGRLLEPTGPGHQLGYQFELKGETVEILAPDGQKESGPPRTVGKLQAIQIPGGTQALRRAEQVTIILGEQDPVHIRRPTLLGAILLKARSLEVHRRPKDQRSDLILLLSLLEDPSAARDELTRQRACLATACQQATRFLRSWAASLLYPRQLERAESAYTLMTR